MPLGDFEGGWGWLKPQWSPQFAATATCGRISISVWHPLLSTLITIQGYLYWETLLVWSFLSLALKTTNITTAVMNNVAITKKALIALILIVPRPQKQTVPAKDNSFSWVEMLPMCVDVRPCKSSKDTKDTRKQKRPQNTSTYLSWAALRSLAKLPNLAI